jgi:hypothetical protein
MVCAFEFLGQPSPFTTTDGAIVFASALVAGLATGICGIGGVVLGMLPPAHALCRLPHPLTCVLSNVPHPLVSIVVTPVIDVAQSRSWA